MAAGGGVSSPVFRSETVDQIALIRLDEHPVDRRIGEITAHRYLETFGLPIPLILKFEFNPPELDRSIALTSRISGVPLSTSTGVRSVEDIGIAVGTTLASINRTPVSGYGWVTG